MFGKRTSRRATIRQTTHTHTHQPSHIRHSVLDGHAAGQPIVAVQHDGAQFADIVGHKVAAALGARFARFCAEKQKRPGDLHMVYDLYGPALQVTMVGRVSDQQHGMVTGDRRRYLQKGKAHDKQEVPHLMA